jgi:large subunit ribosomal protein L21
MYAVIRAGGKQYRVAPGDVIRVEKHAPESAKDGKISFDDVLAVSGSEGQIAKPTSGAHVTGHIVEEGRGDKVLVFHYKRKKQYKKLAGHRQPFTAVKITEIAFDGQSFKAESEHASPKVKAKPARAEHHETTEAAREHIAPKHEAKHTEHKAETKHAAPKHEARHKAPPKKAEAKSHPKKKK